MASFITFTDHGATLRLYVQPGGKKSEILGLFDSQLKVRLAAPALEGKANKELCDFMAQIFAVSKGSVEILKGLQSRKKLVQLTGVSESSLPEEILALIEMK